ncbi:MAG TPA: serine/threonine-protein kinase [Kofleriaceae bacterium]|nr:serine/threonine-protein kinase [Kofleriaceae bacterium]
MAGSEKREPSPGGEIATEILPATDDVHLPATRDSVRELGPLIGRTLGKFTIVERLGRGGSGEVYRAEQVQLGRSAVIKVLRQDVMASPNRVDRFLREAKLASRLDHPYAAHVYAFGAERDGVLWIAMEHVRGATLDELVGRRGPMPPALFGPLFGRLCEVVHTAHELGIVHRDIKGSNVMVIDRAGQLLPKLLDFGIAKGLDGHVSPGAADAASLTGHGSTLGSPHYMAPEQWRAPADVDARADIYALGVLAYRCVAGRLPFQDIERPGLSAAHQTMAPPPLPASVPPAIAEVIVRALAKDPVSRWASALAFGEAMRRAVGGSAPEPVPILDPATRDAWYLAGPQPIADAIARLARATTTVDADTAVRELVAITCRWLAVLALSQLDAGDSTDGRVREHARALVGRDDAAPWLRLARAASVRGLPGLEAALAGAGPLEALADRLDGDRTRTAARLAVDVAAVAEAMQALEPLLAYHLVVGRNGAAESWQGVRRRDRDRVVVWGEPLDDDQVALLDGTNRVVAKLSPLVQVCRPVPSADPELFLLWRTGRGHARLVAAPWGFERDDEAAASVLASLTTEDVDTVADASEKSPYPGLAAYGIADAERFVGREREVEALANRLVRAPLVAVLGPSGAGKSSFIHAGVVPRLAEHAQVITLRPGRHPLHALVAAAAPGLADGTEDTSSASDDDLVTRLRALGEQAARGLVVVIDQLEELVTLCSDPAERARFAAVLGAAADGPSAPVRVVVTLRDDFASVIESEDGFRGRFEVFVLATPAPEALRRIIVEPARRAQITVEPQVVDDIVAEVAGRPASLPLVSFTAQQLWAARDRAHRTITHAAYVELGGVAGAVATYADQVYGALGRRDQDVVRDLFARLVANDGTRIPAPRDELEQLSGAGRVLAHLIDARLLVVRDDPDDGDVVEIVHECLAERWPRLARWRQEDAADRALLVDVGVAARRWHEAGRRSDLLWRGEALTELRRLATRSTALTDVERAFAGEADRAARRTRRRRRIAIAATMIALGAVAVVMAYLGLVADRNRSEAERSANQAREAALLAEERLTTSLVAQGRRELNDGRALPALAYFGEALRRGADTPALRLMIALASRGWPFEIEVRRDAAMTEVESSPRGWAVAGDMQGRIHFFADDGKRTGEVATELGYITGLFRQPDDRIFAVGRHGVAIVDPAMRHVVQRFKPKSEPMAVHVGPAPGEVVSVEEGAVRVYDLTGKLLREVALTSRQTQAEPRFEPSGAHVVVSGFGDVDVVDTARMTIARLAHEIDGTVGGTRDGSLMGYVDSDGVAHLITGDGKPVRTFRPSNRPHTLIFSPTGDRIAGLAESGLVVHDEHGKPIWGIAIKSPMTLIELRGDEVWLGTAEGVLQRYVRGSLVASLPSQLGELDEMLVAGRSVLSVSSTGSFVVARADAVHAELGKALCDGATSQTIGLGVAYRCDELWHVFIGAREVAKVADREVGNVAYDERSRRSAIAGEAISVFDDHGTRIAQVNEDDGELGGIAFADPEHLLVARPEKRPGVWRWTIGTKDWVQLATVPDAMAVVPAAGGLFVGTRKKLVVVVRGGDGKELVRSDVGAVPLQLTASGNGQWVAAQLANGATAIFDGTTGALVRQLEPAEVGGAAATFDPTGELVMRPARGAMTIYDRASGDALVWNLDLLQETMNARFTPDGRIERDSWEPGILQIAPDRRPVPDILRDIDCRVPLRVVGVRLAPATPTCGPVSAR